MQNKIPIENLKSLFYQLEYINCIIERTLESQTIIAEEELIEKLNDLDKLRENNLNLSSKIMNMNNIIKIEEFLSYNYPKILSFMPKLNLLAENINDLKPNINYSLDKLFLEDNIVCDEKIFKENLEKSSNLINNITEENDNKNIISEEIKSNYLQLKNIIENQKKKFSYAKILIDKLKEQKLKEERKK